MKTEKRKLAASGRECNKARMHGCAKMTAAYQAVHGAGEGIVFGKSDVANQTGDTFLNPRVKHLVAWLGSESDGRESLQIAEYLIVYSPESKRVYQLDLSQSGGRELSTEQGYKKREVVAEESLVGMLNALKLDKVALEADAICRFPKLSKRKDWIEFKVP